MPTPMTPVEITSRFPRLSRRNPGRLAAPHLEAWSAISADRVWTYEREESPGTPWIVTHTPTGMTSSFGSLPAARRWTASPSALPSLRGRAEQVIRAEGGTGAIVCRRVDGVMRRVEEDPAECSARVAEALRRLLVLGREGSLR